ncbi:MAG: tetratricopeptide repeat protein [Terriglobia bacterium]|jgi:tetratricopeptide (TPR) repeat protein|nr:tetratricopeptide repeat protein [Terriglobia bacterium]
MKPYCRIAIVTLLLLTSFRLLATSTYGGEDFKAVNPANNQLSRRAFDHFYDMEYERSIREFEQLQKEYPENPIANNYLAAAVVFGEMYRIGALDTETYATDSFLDLKAKRPLNPETTKRINELLDRSEKLCDARLDKNPNDIDALYARGVERGLRSTFMGMGQKAWMSAIRSALAARRDHERVLQLDPKFVDAKMTIGVHNYIIGSLNWFYRTMIAVTGVTGNKQKGLNYLREVADSNCAASMDARIALALFLRREQKYPEALNVVKSMMDEYPKNYMVALEYANLENASGHADDAIASYRKILENYKERKYPTANPQAAAFGLGITLRGQRRFDEAAKAFGMVASFPESETRIVIRSTLAAGEMYDTLKERDRAVEKYEEVLAADASSPEGQLAKKHLGKPYHYD